MKISSPLRYFTLAAPSSGSGKTTISIGLMVLFKKLGLSVQPFKVGPDYIDPKYHETATGNISYNLDGWLLSKDYIEKRFFEESLCHDISIIEGVMGLYDGINGTSEEGSTAQIAKWLTSPVVLVVDARAASRSVAAVVKGFELFDPAIDLRGVILNRVGSTRHFEMIKSAIRTNCLSKVIGCLPADNTLCLPSRHLGLISSTQDVLTPSFLNHLVSTLKDHIDIDLLLELTQKDRPKKDTPPKKNKLSGRKKKFSIAVAFDDAFCFYYEDNFKIIKESGCTLHFFSPLKDTALPKGTDFVYLGGGYPEVFAEALHKNRSLKKEIKQFAEAGGGIYAECGGLMYLSKRLISINKKEYDLTGVFPFTCVMREKRTALGYVSVFLKEDCYLGKKGTALRGHEYHYSDILDVPETIVKKYTVIKNGKRKKEEGYTYKNVLASYVHIHFGMHPDIVSRFCTLRM